MRLLSRRIFLQQTVATALAAGTSLSSPSDAQPLRLTTRAAVGKERARILAVMQQVMGELSTTRKSPLEIQKLEEEKLPGFTRRRIQFSGGDGDQVPAFLLMPHNLKKSVPAVLCLHQTTRIGKGEPAGIGGKTNLHYARELAERGFITLAPDYPNFGDYQFDPYAHGYVSATMKGICNHIRAVDVLQSLPEVNKNSIGVIGHSLGGHNALFVSAFDPRIRAIVTSCGFTSFKKYYGGNLTGWSHKGYMPLIAEKYGKDPARMPFDFPQVLIALAPRPLFINAPLHDANFEISGVRDCVAAALPVYERVFSARKNLVAVYPDAQHDFPEPARKAAYEFFEKWLKQSSFSTRGRL